MYKNGHGLSQYNLDVNQYHRHAVKWFSKAAKQGDPAAEFNLGMMYKNGMGVVQNYEEAVKWFRKSAEKGFKDAQFNLGLMYQRGKGIKQDHIHAHMWFSIASVNGEYSSYLTRGLRIKQLKIEDELRARRLALNCKRKKYKNC